VSRETPSGDRLPASDSRALIGQEAQPATVNRRVFLLAADFPVG
jgi:hypothetical protein